MFIRAHEAGYMCVATLSEKDLPVLVSGRCPYKLFRLKRLLNNGNFFMWRTAPAALWSEQLFDHVYLRTNLMTGFKTGH